MRKLNKITKKNLITISLMTNISFLKSISFLRRFLNLMSDGRYLYRKVYIIEEK